jgi:PAS domain S-box-containing protein
MFGAGNQKLEGRSVLEVLHPESREMAIARIQQIMETGRTTDWVEQKLVRLNGEEFLAETKGIPFRYQGIPGVLTIVRDITERKKSHQTLLRYERLAAVGKVIAGIAHEIRNPLAVVSGMSHVLQQKFAGRPEFSEEVDAILLQTERLRLFMTDILDYSRELLIKKNEVDPKALMEKSLKLVQTQVDPLQASIQVKWIWEINLPFLWADGERLEQILVNLILNAFQSMGRKGTIILSGQAREGWIFLGVEDDGPGISEADLPRLFEPFFTTKKHGSGLGLPISKKIVEAHGGKIEVRRIQPHGTLFTLQLPNQKI